MPTNPRGTSLRKLANLKLGNRIVALRANLKMNQAEFGKHLGASAMSISRWEGGSHRPPANFLIKLGLLADHDECWFFWGQAGLTWADVVRVMSKGKRRVPGLPTIRTINK